MFFVFENVEYEDTDNESTSYYVLNITSESYSKLKILLSELKALKPDSKILPVRIYSVHLYCKDLGIMFMEVPGEDAVKALFEQAQTNTLADLDGEYLSEGLPMRQNPFAEWIEESGYKAEYFNYPVSEAKVSIASQTFNFCSFSWSEDMFVDWDDVEKIMNESPPVRHLYFTLKYAKGNTLYIVARKDQYGWCPPNGDSYTNNPESQLLEWAKDPEWVCTDEKEASQLCEHLNKL